MSRRVLRFSSPANRAPPPPRTLLSPVHRLKKDFFTASEIGPALLSRRGDTLTPKLFHLPSFSLVRTYIYVR